MNVLVLNGSQKGDRSNTMWLTRAFLEGFPEDANIETIALKDLNIHPCLGCFSCWTKTPGVCAIKDDMQDVYRAILNADVIIESFPLYFAGVPSAIRMMTERCLCFTKRYEGSPEDSFHSILPMGEHDLLKKKLVLISSCGYVSMDTMFDGLLKEYDLICGEGNYSKILCAQGELLQAGDKTRQVVLYLDRVREAGREFATNLTLSAETEADLSKPMVSDRTFEVLIKRYWQERME